MHQRDAERHAVHIHALGFGEGLTKLGVMPPGVHQRRWDDGRALLRTPLDTEIDSLNASRTEPTAQYADPRNAA